MVPEPQPQARVDPSAKLPPIPHRSLAEGGVSPSSVLTLSAVTAPPRPSPQGGEGSKGDISLARNGKDEEKTC